MRKNYGEGKPLVLDSVVIQSPSLIKKLGEVFEGYSGITTSLKKLVFKYPFRPFYYRWAQFGQILERQKLEDPAASKHSRLLYDVLNTELGSTMAEINDLFQHRVMTYPLLWSLFEPGMRIVTKEKGHERFFILENCVYNYDKGYLAVKAKLVDWDGKRFGWTNGQVAICEYFGTRDIIQLDVYFTSFHHSREKTEAMAIARGQKFRDLCGFHYKAYSGQIHYRDDGRNITRNVSSDFLKDEYGL